MSVPDDFERRRNRPIAGRKTSEKPLEVKSRIPEVEDPELDQLAGRLAEQVELTKVILDAVPNVVMTCDENLRIETVNCSCLTVLGYAQADFVGTCLTDIIPGLSDFEHSIAKDSFVISGVGVRKQDGSYIDAELRGIRTPLHGRPLIAVVLHDISERTASERTKEKVYRQLHESRRLEAIGALASGIAHEINTPIQFIDDNVKFVSLSLDKIYSSYQRYDKLKVECEVQKLLSELVNDIDDFNQGIDLTFLVKEIYAAIQETIEGIHQVRDVVLLMKELAHPGKGPLEKTDINRVVKGALTLCRGRIKNSVSVDTALDPGVPEIVCQRRQIQQSLINMIVNAVEAIEEHGIKTGRLRIATKSSCDVLRIEISDTGPGIPETLREKIFDPFFTTKMADKGTGQGLALARDIIVKQHGGRLFLEDRAGFSTSFVIELPLNFHKATAGSEEAFHAASP